MTAPFEDPTGPSPAATPSAAGKDLFVLCGGGSTARTVIEELIRTGRRFLVIEEDAEACARLRGFLPPECVLQADATDEAALEKAGVREARALLALLHEDRLNLVVVVTALQLNPGIRVVARGDDEAHAARLRRLGAVVVSTAHIGGRRLAAGMIHPEATGFLNEMLTAPSERPIRFEAVVVTEGSEAAGRTLDEIDVYGRARLKVAAVCRGADGPFTHNPGPGTRLQPGDRIVVFGDFERVDRLAAIVGRWE